MTHLKSGVILLLAIAACLGTVGSPVLSQNAVDFSGTVLKVDEAAGKLTVKKEGARFTFVIDGRTQYAGVKALREIKAGDSVTVTYIVMGSQYVAQKVAKGK